MTAGKKPAALGNAAGQAPHEPTTAHAGAIVAAPSHDGDGLPRFSARQARVIAAMLPGDWITRETMDRIAGASNSPDTVQKLRHKLGHDAIETELYAATDRDGKPCRPGRYRLTEQGRARLARSSASPSGEVPTC